MTARRPVVGIPASVFEMRQFPLHAISQSNAVAVARVSNCHPMVIPALGDDIDVADLVEHIDGLLLTGGASNSSHTTTTAGPRETAICMTHNATLPPCH